MKTRLILVKGTAMLLLLSTFNPQLSTAFAQGTAFTYQGRLNDGTNPANGSYDLRFTVFDALTGGSTVGGPLTNGPTTVSNGVFAVVLDFGAVFPGANRWLEVAARTNGVGNFSVLSPRQPLTAAPYAVTAGTVTGVVPGTGLSGTYGSPVTFVNNANTFSGNGSGLINLNANNLASGSVPSAALNNAWKTTGNTGTSPTNGNFIGTTDFQPLDLKAGGMRVLRLQPDPRTDVGGQSGNLIGGFTGNVIEAPESGGDFIGGGGYPAGPNIIHSNSSGVFIGAGSANQIGPNLNDSFVGAGFGNTIQSADSAVVGGVNNTIQINAQNSSVGGGYQNSIQINAPYSVIGGGYQNTIKTNGVVAGAFADIGGGELNTVSAQNATIGGGYDNIASGAYATVGGGDFNVASGMSSTVPGGEGNVASGDYSFAAGWTAQATHYGSFVWSDQSSSFTFGSTTSNQFSVRAFGGVNFSTGGAGMMLDGQPVATAGPTGNAALRAGGNAFTGEQVITGPDAVQLLLQNSSDGRYWSLYDENFGGSGALIFQPNTGVGAYIRRTDGNYIVNSDERLKRDITPLGPVLDRVLQLRPVSYHFKSAPEGTPLSLGLIAQEVKPLFPDVVGERNGMMSMAYTELVPVTIRAIQELNQKLELDLAAQQKTSEAKIQGLEKENENLRLRLEKIEQWMARTDVAAK